jgi:3,4-dihydroxy 2-butanone 4-phosphate synthase/GTP cyclohydrolase II
MATHGRGLICAPLIEDRCDELGLELMVSTNSAAYETPFTVSVDLIGHGTTTGISASDRSKTVMALINPSTKPEELGKPGHIFPLRAKRGGVLRRAGHTEAAIDFARLAGFEPAGLIVEIMNEDGSMARLPQLLEIATRFNLKIVSIEDLIAYRLQKDSIIERSMEVELPTHYGNFKLVAYRQKTNDAEHFALYCGQWTQDEPVLTRVHSGSMVGDIFGSAFFGKGAELHAAMDMIAREGKGVLVYINKLRKDEGILDELRALQASKEASDSGQQTDAMDNRDYGVGAQILRELGVRKMRLITNTPSKKAGLIGYDLEIVEHVPVGSLVGRFK